MNTKHQGKYVRTPAPAQLKEIKKVSLRRRITRIRRTIKHNRFYQFALCILICLIVFGSGRIYQYSVDKDNFNIQLEAEIAELEGGYEATILQLNDAHREEIMELRNEYENLTPEEQLQQEAEYIAKVLYGTGRNHDERDQRTLVWCILNRVDSIGYPGTIKEVCQQASQWIGYSDDNPVLSELYDLALKELETWHSNYRPVSEDYVYMSWSSNEIKLRDSYEKKNDTRYWQAG